MEESKKEELEFLNREEMRTMAKDIAILREEEAFIEREKIASLQPEGALKTQGGRGAGAEEIPAEKKIEKKMELEKKKKKKQIEEERMFVEETNKRIEEERRQMELREREREGEKKREKDAREKEEIKKRGEEEERKRQEEIKRQEEKQREEEKRKNIITREKTRRDREERRAQLEKELSNIFTRKEPLEIKREQLLNGISQIKNKIAPLLKEEEHIEEEKIKADEREELAISQERKREIEKDRWRIEEKRHAIEEKRWEIEKEIRKFENELKTTDEEYRKITEEEDELKARVKEISAREESITLGEKKKRIEEQLVPLGIKIEDLSAKEKQLEDDLIQTLDKEKKLENEIKIIEKEEKKAISSLDKTRAEEIRWSLEKQRKETENKKWEQKDKKKSLGNELKKIRSEYQRLLDEEERVEKRLKEIAVLCQQTEIEPGAAKEAEEYRAREEKTEDVYDKQKFEEKIAETIRDLEEIKKAELKKALEKTEKAAEEKSVAISGEIKQRLENIGATEEEEEEEEEEGEKIPAEIISRHRASLFEKIFVRLAVVIIIALVAANFIGLWFWYKGQPIHWFWITPAPNIEEKPIPPEEPASTPSTELLIPPALFPVNAAETIEVAQAENIPAFLSETSKKSFEEKNFTRILIKNTSENRYLGLKDFFNTFQIDTPDGFFEKLNDDFTLYIYTVEKRNSLGFVAKITEINGLQALLKSWEKTMENDFKKLSEVFAKDKIAVTPGFKEKTYKGAAFRYLTITPNPDYFGMCYGLFKDYFIYTSSCNNTMNLIDLLIQQEK